MLQPNNAASINVMDGEGGNIEITGYVISICEDDPHLVVLPMENGEQQPILHLPVDTILSVETNTILCLETADREYYGQFLLASNNTFVLWSEDFKDADHPLIIVPISQITAVCLA